MKKYNDFKKIYSSKKLDEDIFNGKRGSENNVKIKLILPFFQSLGYDILKDMDFEFLRTDIVLSHNKNKLLIVETKSWGKIFTNNNLNQCLEYSLKLKTPLILLTSGDHAVLYSSLINPKKLEKPILEFYLEDLLKKDKFSKIYAILGKENLIKRQKINKIIKEKLPKNKSLKQAEKEFKNESSKPKYKSRIKIIPLTDEIFNKKAKKHGSEIYNALILAKKEFEKICSDNKKILQIRYRSKERGIEYKYYKLPRPKLLGLVGIYPEKAKIAFGLESWEILLKNSKDLDKIKKFPKDIKNKKQVKELINLLQLSIKKIK
ncbi:hypothetical protein KJ671_02285 [Patescibacteria group bacterium]|nr:hypothetical protein [Patescibacteria group bacterium]